ncbi:hypothetical protein QTN47_03890 [Danxiaibacter flavus]|uniref:Uncharacterized protein n=1 Tax=Danxiaibacter flavus TaxID=3049108 RepID=A0ABV3Z9T5_9BACT|nr:hypothetical protein QNM32_03890 [Chitinophagaceae bacterium DXS]
MVRLLVLISIICSVAVSCNKTNDIQLKNNSVLTNGNMHKVSYKLNGLGDLGNGRTNSKEVAAGSYLDYLFYAVYDSTGKLVHKKEQRKIFSPDNFGFISDSLLTGSYNVVVAGTKDSLLFANGYNQLNTLQLSGNFPQDVFCSKFSLSVGNKDTSLNNIRLDRLTGQLEIVLTDSLLALLYQTITCSVTNHPQAYNVMADSTVGSTYAGRTFYGYQMGQKTSVFDAFFLGSDSTYTIEILANTGYLGGNVSKKIKNVKLYRNKKTILTGSFNNASSTVNANRAGDVTDKHFIIQHF